MNGCAGAFPVASLVALLVASLVASSGAPRAASAGEPMTAAELSEASLPLRTALHHDPTMAAPFDRLVEIYRGAGKLDDLVRMYRMHLASFPGDAGALAVLARLLQAAGDPEAEAVVRAAARDHPESAYLRYLLYGILRAAHDPKALDELDRAIALEAHPARKRLWIETCVAEAVAHDRRDLAERELRALVEIADGSAPGVLDAAQRMMEHGLHERALEALATARPETVTPEAAVDMELTAAAAEGALGRADAARGRLDRLLGRLTADYWRRPEVLRRRASLVTTDSERKAMVDAARARAASRPHDEAAALDLAELLSAFEFRREALEALLEAGARVPESARIERRALELFDRLRDERGREKYLAERVKHLPERRDLRLQRARTLLFLGRRKEAMVELDQAVSGAEGPERFRVVLETARSLRASGAISDAADLFGRALALEPARLDVRRELAEVRLALGERQKARELFAERLPADAPVEGLMDLVQFMIAQELYSEARDALAERAKADASGIEVRMLLLGVLGKLGRRDEGAELADLSRPLADTPARYRLWLEGAVQFHEAFEAEAGFLDVEQARLALDGARTPEDRLDRQDVFMDVASRSGLKVAVVSGLESELLNRELPAAVRARLRRRLVSVLAEDVAQAAPQTYGSFPQPQEALPQHEALERHLRELAKEDPSLAPECDARLALVFIARDRHDLARALTEKLDLAALTDAALVSRLEQVFAQQGDQRRARDALERLVALDPTNRASWERWVSALASERNETRLRTTLRRLVAGVERMPLSDGTTALLRRHVADSCWRSVCGLLLAGGREVLPTLSEALEHLATTESCASTRNQWLWVAWARAHVLNLMGRAPERDQAIAELSRVASERPPAAGDGDALRAKTVASTPRGSGPGAGNPAGDPRKASPYPSVGGAPLRSRRVSASPAPPGGGRDADEPADPDQPLAVEDGIAFPDGLSVSLEQARALLTAKPSAGTRPGVEARGNKGPAPPFALAWIFETDDDADVTCILRLDRERLLVSDLRGSLYCVESATGKLVWQAEGALPGASVSPPQPGYPYARGRCFPMPPGYCGDQSSQQPAVLPAADGSGRIYLSKPGEIECLADADGTLLWKATVATGSSQVPAAALKGEPGLPDSVLAFDGASGTAVSLDPWTGRLLWERVLPDAPRLQPGMWRTDGASVEGERFLVYGARAAVLDSRTGEVLWSFDPERVSRFPVTLKEPLEEGAQAPAPVVGPWSWSPYSSRYGPWGGAPPVQLVTAYGSGMGGGAVVGMGPYGYRAAAQATALAAPAVVWAEQAGDRLGVVSGPFLLLFGQSGLVLANTELPVVAAHASASGAFVGVSGNTACLLSQGALTLVDAPTGRVKTMPLQELAAGKPNARLGAAVSGPSVYVAGPGGIACVIARSGARVFLAPWPEGARDQGDDASAGSLNYRLAGISRVVSGRWTPPVPPADLVADGALYLVAGPSRVAAIVEDRAGGER